MPKFDKVWEEGGRTILVVDPGTGLVVTVEGQKHGYDVALEFTADEWRAIVEATRSVWDPSPTTSQAQTVNLTPSLGWHELKGR